MLSRVSKSDRGECMYTHAWVPRSSGNAGSLRLVVGFGFVGVSVVVVTSSIIRSVWNK